MATINFYSTRSAHGYMSNFYAAPITMPGPDGVPRLYPTSEHYFQAAKFFTTAPEYAETIRTTAAASGAARLGRSRAHPLRPDWETVKNNLMRAALDAKFNQHPNLMLQLDATGDATLVEHTTNDSYWGDGGDGSGQNWLGRLLMQVREANRI